MRKFAVILGIVVGCGISTLAYADETTAPVVEPAVINNPSAGWDLTKDVVKYLEPGADWVFAFNDGEPFNGFSGALYTFHSKGWPLASVRAGYGLQDPITYGSLSLDLPGLAGRFIPDVVKGVSPDALNGAAAFAAKYLRVGPMFGYDWAETQPKWGVAVGAAITF